MYGNISRILLKFVQYSLPEKNIVELEEIRYGLEAMISFVIKTITILMIGYLLGLASYVITTIICLAVIKPFSGGAHAKNEIQCMIITTCVIFSIIFLSLNLHLSLVTKGLLYVFCFILLLNFAPADTEEKPYINENLRKRLKIISLVMCSLMMASSLYVFQGVTGNIIIFSILASSLFTTPAVYKIMGRRYKNYEYFQI